ncbi:MAG: (4Fe-4S)-binding protein [Deltaproteobacteria bacterium]|nr:MAG: (4Fe-4S)-binding protein [Deltaproteobacteria bacterium]
MRELVVLSGKGGTGKTSLVGALAALAQDKLLCDADVDAADLHLLLRPEVRGRQNFYAGHKAVIDPDRCVQCGECLEWCRFGAISGSLEINHLVCEGCGVCWYLCPAKAIDFPDNLCGEWFISATRFGPLVHARLGIAEENSGKLVALVRREARRVAEEQSRGWIITDGPPGIGCPVIASLGDASAVLIVTEPSIAGRHDLERVATLVRHFGLPVLVLVNKADVHWETAKKIAEFCREKGYAFLGYLPFDPDFTRAQVEGKTIMEYNNKKLQTLLQVVWERLTSEIAGRKPKGNVQRPAQT